MGAFIDGRLIKGSKESASGIGHMVVSAEGPKCMCGRRGCLEVFASEPAMLRSAQVFMKRELTAQELFAAAREEDDIAQKVVSEALDYPLLQ